MLRKAFCCGALLAWAGLVSAVVLSPSAAGAVQDQEAKALAGTWTKKDAKVKVEFSGKDVIKFAPHGEFAVISISCNYTVNKDGLVKAKIYAVDGQAELIKKAQELVPIGLEFTFKWVANGETATLEDIAGKGTEALKSHLEGSFEQAK